MSGNKYISRADFNKSEPFIKINNRIETCLKLIDKLIKHNRIKLEECSKLDVVDYIKDYRVDQFKYINSILLSIYYDCYSLKNVFDVHCVLRINGVDQTIVELIDNQRRYITFNAIIRMAGIFEYSRKSFDEVVKKVAKRDGQKGDYFENLKVQYTEHRDFYSLLRDFRNTVHTNGKWDKDESLKYSIVTKKHEIKKGEYFQYTHFFLYSIFKNAIDLHAKLAFANEPKLIRETHLKHGDQNLVVARTQMSSEDWDNLFKDHGKLYNMQND